MAKRYSSFCTFESSNPKPLQSDTWIKYSNMSMGDLFDYHYIADCVLLNILMVFYNTLAGPSWPWSYGRWIYNYLCNQCLSLLMLWIRISIRARCTTLCNKVCQWLATGRWFSPGPQVSTTDKTYRHDIVEILLKVALSTLK